ncbi:hypothetical protein NO004_40070 [Flavobacterium psychrophilum]|uniref:hypothetical protein n=1 Tax=Flavobacterium psychrophilum TaxID=96345 RepID=UPI000B7C1527|nr:hypothetical protein [Flavobacterium psychrophilum]SNB26561.1 hypothetical protein NO004_40070 [Flavobacterium psychrophilum]
MMRNENMIKPLTQQCEQTSVRDSIFRYCWGNETAKTWFITKNLKCFLPKGSRLLLRIEGEITSEKLSSCNLPQNGDVVSDIDGTNILVKKVIWV